MDTFFDKDRNVEMEVSKFIDEFLYPYLGDVFERKEEMNFQMKGIDILLKQGKRTFKIDDKCAFYFANKDLKTFAFELSYLKNRQVRLGWLFKESLTTHYNLMWLKTKNPKIKPQKIRANDIAEVESIIISKDKLLSYLGLKGFDQKYLRQINRDFRKSAAKRKKLDNHIHLVKSVHLAECPINLVIDKQELSKLAIYHLKITETKIWDVKKDKEFISKPKETKGHNMDKKDTYTDGEKAELIVFDAIRKYADGRDYHITHRYDLHNYGHQGMRQIDVLFVDKEYGITVIEVKGINIDQIDSIKAGTWYYRNYHSTSGNPFQQGVNQLNLLCNQIEQKNPSLFLKFSKRVIVALPSISKSQWKARGFDRIPNMPPILFKDHIENTEKIDELMEAYIYRAKEAIDEKKWHLLLSHFYFEKNEEEIEPIPMPKYSKLYVLPSKDEFKKRQSEIKKLLKDGIKIYLLCYFDLASCCKDWLKSSKDFIEKYQLQYFINTTKRYPSEFIMDDGNADIPDQILRDFPKFNHRQYVVAHAAPDANLMITAGAGTGKTHVMVDRILYLVSQGVKLKDIIMITFTNKSTDEMKERLQKKLLTLYKLTGKTNYGLMAEDIKDLQISTIHSFSKSILQVLGHELGFGVGFSVRSFAYEKNKVIRDLIDEFYQENPGTEVINELADYELEKAILNFWDEMEKKGLSIVEMEDGLDWGKALKPEYEPLNKLFSFVFKRCERRLDEIKRQENALSTNDLIRKIKELGGSKEKLKQLNRDKYLFIDEFQDSDNVQIELVASLSEHLDYKLFVVGDVKQSIYRFRGADYRSFDLLEKKVKTKPFKKYSLNQNYRTLSSLLDKLDNLFVNWGKKKWLPYDEKLVGMKERESENGEDLQIYSYRNRKNFETCLIEKINKAFKMVGKLSKDENKKVALLVRTNSQAVMLENLCRKMKIPTTKNLDGTFYISEAVRDFKALLDGLMYPNSAKHLINALQSPYFGYRIPYSILLRFSGDNEGIIDFINKKIGNAFGQYVEKLKTLPVMAVIQKIISEEGLYRNLQKIYSDRIEDEIQRDILIQQYRKNLFHLMNIIQQQFDTANTTLHNLYQWLVLMMRTNRSENEPSVETKDRAVEIITVHRAKGLEYHTVIIPYTNFDFGIDHASFHIEDEDKKSESGKRKVAWRIKDAENNNFNDLDKYDKEEIIKEETRLLYVALTRAINQLAVLVPEQMKYNTWSQIIRETGVEVKRYGR